MNQLNNPSIKNRINSDLDSLDCLNALYNWIPNRHSIRPTPEQIQIKLEKIQEIESEWESFFDFVLHNVFEQNYTINYTGKKFIQTYDKSTLASWVFKPSDFKYQLSDNSNHFILWSSEFNIGYDFDDLIINNIISNKIKEMIGDSDFDFAWYKNPKPSIPEFYHVQVFWIQL